MTVTRRRDSPAWDLGPRGGLGWPVMAGAATAVGAVGAREAYGLVGMTALFFGIGLLTLVSVWSVADELRLEQRRLLRTLPLTVALGIVATAGWCDLFGAYGLVAVAAVALTSPAFGTLVRQRLPRPSATAGPSGVRVDQAAVDRRFRGIVGSLDEEQGGPSSAT